MLEFLKECDRDLYDIAIGLENQIKTEYSFVAMRRLLEAELKKIYCMYRGKAPNGDLAGLINDAELKTYIRTKTGSNDFYGVDELVRLNGNRAAHYDVRKKFIWDNKKIKETFHSVYDFSGIYYLIASGKKAPVWSEEAYEEILNNALDCNTKKENEEKYGRMIEETRQAMQEEQKRNKECQEKIDSLQKQLDELKSQSNNSKELERYKAELKEKTDDCNRLESQNVILKKKIADSTSPEEREALNKKLQNAKTEINSIKQEKKKLEEQLKREQERLADPGRYKELSEKLEQARKAEKESTDKLEELKLENSYLTDEVYKAQSQNEELFHKYLVEQSDKRKLLDELESQCKEYEWKRGSLNIPRCVQCNARLVAKTKGDAIFWGCPNYGKTCNAKTRRVQPEEQTIFYESLKLQEASREEQERVRVLSAGRSAGYYIKEIPDRREERNAVNGYRASLIRNNPGQFCFGSLAVPRKVFKGSRCSLSEHASFLVEYKALKTEVPDKERQIYSLVLRLLGRGRVLPISATADENIAEVFTEEGSCKPEILRDYMAYEDNYEGYRSNAAKRFAEEILRPILGRSWMSYVLINPGADMLLPDGNHSHNAYRFLDFAIFRGDKKIVICISENNDRETIESTLSHYGFNVFYFAPEELEKNKEYILKSLGKALYEDRDDDDKTEEVIAVSPRYLVAAKLVNQIQIAVLKGLEQGYILTGSNIKVVCETELLSETEIDYITTVALSELSMLINNYCELYNHNKSIDLINPSGNEFRICIGSGGTCSAVVRDIYVPFFCPCEIEELTLDYLPSAVNRRILEFFAKYIYGYDGCREGQVEAINRVLARKDSIVLLPTGSGKSAIYQIAAFLVPGMIVVISPLTSLIEDQIQNLEERNGINNILSITSESAGRGNGGRNVNDVLGDPMTALVYISPERLQIPRFRKSVDFLLKANNVFTVAIDEAHCVSEWGHDFRPAYLNLGKTARKIFEKNNYVPTLVALTGTASDAVLSDVQRDLNILDDSALIVPATFDREELKFGVVTCDAEGKIVTIASLLRSNLPEEFGCTYSDFVRRSDGAGYRGPYPGIIFTPNATSKKSGEYDALSVNKQLQDMLPQIGIGAYFSKVPEEYDSETWKKTKKEFATRFRDDEINLLVATKAYGMGIDKKNIRFTIHDGMPNSIEEFYQEAGRAGRDRGKSSCILVFSNENDTYNEKLLDPALGIDEVVGRCKEYNNSDGYIKDDLSTLMHFHTSTFSGIEEECEDVNIILDVFEQRNPKRESSFVTALPYYMDCDRSQSEKRWIKSIIRLITLGIVKDYTYDYNGNFEFVMGDLSRDGVISSYRKYVEIYQEDRARIEAERLSAVTDRGWGFARVAVRTLITYIYDTIEKSRRTALREMFVMAKTAGEMPASERDQYIRTRILQYLAINKECKDLFAAVINGKNGGYEAAEDVSAFHLNEVVETDEETEFALQIVNSVGRVMESHADHPGLLLLRALTEIKTGDRNNLIADDITASFRFAVERYGVSEEIAMVYLLKILNTSLTKSIALYDVVRDRIATVEWISKLNMDRLLMSSELISNANRDVIVLEYYEKRLSEVIGNGKR